MIKNLILIVAMSFVVHTVNLVAMDYDTTYERMLPGATAIHTYNNNSCDSQERETYLRRLRTEYAYFAKELREVFYYKKIQPHQEHAFDFWVLLNVTTQQFIPKSDEEVRLKERLSTAIACTYQDSQDLEQELIKKALDNSIIDYEIQAVTHLIEKQSL